jgi:PAS domain S-box-containing protein
MSRGPDIPDHPARVLIVDDDPHNRQLLEVMLAPWGYALQTATNGEEALALVAEQPPDLVLLDIMMPGMDGYQVARHLKAGAATLNIPIIMITALDDTDARMRGLNAGAEEFLTKPVERAELSVRVKNLLRLKAYGDYHDRYSHMLEEQVAVRTADLQAERDRAQRYLDTAGVFLLALDNDGRITLANRYACATLGWSAEELLGRDWIENCVPPRIRGFVRGRFRNLSDRVLPLYESFIVTRSGVERLIEWRHTIVRDAIGRATGSLSSGTDVTERTIAVAALRATEERMRFALENANVGIWDLDCVTGAARWSEILESQFGLEPGRFGGTFQAFVDLVHPDDRSLVIETMAKAIESGADFSYAHRAILPDGSTRWLSGAGRILLGERGEPVRGVGVYQDITERRTLGAQNEQLQKMEAVGRLAGGVAHDFNNLLTVILGFCELLLTDLALDDPRHADIAEIQQAGTRGAGLTRQLLAFSRKQIIQPTLLDLNAVVTGMQVMVGRLIGEDVTIVMALRPDLALVMADRGQIEQIIMNLAVNARDAMPMGGTLTIETANLELDEHYAGTGVAVKPGPYVGLTVTDSGTGMTPEVQARLFEPFFTTKAAGRGTGLGMATVHGIVTQSGGSVGVYSELGKGTAFKMYFPATDSTEVAVDTPAPATRPQAGTHTVLIVEDEAGLRELAKRLLQRHGYTVLVAADAKEALRLFAENPLIDVLLTDVVMPGGSGPELSKKLTKLRPTLRVIYMSGYTEEAIVHHGIIRPGIAFLHKPFTSEGLGEKFREVLGR